jgi:hypothetical protein
MLLDKGSVGQFADLYKKGQANQATELATPTHRSFVRSSVLAALGEGIEFTTFMTRFCGLSLSFENGLDKFTQLLTVLPGLSTSDTGILRTLASQREEGITPNKLTNSQHLLLDVALRAHAKHDYCVEATSDFMVSLGAMHRRVIQTLDLLATTRFHGHSDRNAILKKYIDTANIHFPGELARLANKDEDWEMRRLEEGDTVTAEELLRHAGAPRATKESLSLGGTSISASTIGVLILDGMIHAVTATHRNTEERAEDLGHFATEGQFKARGRVNERLTIAQHKQSLANLGINDYHLDFYKPGAWIIPALMDDKFRAHIITHTKGNVFDKHAVRLGLRSNPGGTITSVKPGDLDVMTNDEEFSKTIDTMFALKWDKRGKHLKDQELTAKAMPNWNPAAPPSALQVLRVRRSNGQVELSRMCMSKKVLRKDRKHDTTKTTYSAQHPRGTSWVVHVDNGGKVKLPKIWGQEYLFVHPTMPSGWPENAGTLRRNQDARPIKSTSVTMGMQSTHCRKLPALTLAGTQYTREHLWALAYTDIQTGEVFQVTGDGHVVNPSALLEIVRTTLIP